MTLQQLRSTAHRAKDPRVLVPLAACTLATAPPAAAIAPVPVVVGSGSPATLRNLGEGPVSLAGSGETASHQSRFFYPPGADQGPDTWYLIRLDATVTLESPPKSGSVLLSGFSRGQAGAQVEFYSARDRKGKPVVRWESVDLIRGQASGVSKGPTARVSYRNYLPYAGVTPGPANLTFQIESFGGARAPQVRIGPRSGIYETHVAPVELKLDARAGEKPLSPGEPVELKVTVTNKSARPAHGVGIGLEPGAPGMFVKGGSKRMIGRIGGNESHTATFTVGRTTSGPLRLGIAAAAASGAEAQTRFQAPVAIQAERNGGSGPWLAAALVALAGACAAAAAFACRKTGGRS